MPGESFSGAADNWGPADLAMGSERRLRSGQGESRGVEVLEVEHHDRDPHHQCQSTSAGEENQYTRKRGRYGALLISHDRNPFKV